MGDRVEGMAKKVEDKKMNEKNNENLYGQNFIEHGDIKIIIDERNYILNLNNYAKMTDTNCMLWHNGTRSGRKSKPLLDFIKEFCPYLINNSGLIDLGWLDDSDDIYLSDASGVDFVLRLTSYLLLRTELREIEDGVCN